MYQKLEIGIDPPAKAVLVGDLARVRFLDGRSGLYEVTDVGPTGIVTMERKEEPREFTFDEQGRMTEEKT